MLADASLVLHINEWGWMPNLRPYCFASAYRLHESGFPRDWRGRGFRLGALAKLGETCREVHAAAVVALPTARARTDAAVAAVEGTLRQEERADLALVRKHGCSRRAAIEVMELWFDAARTGAPVDGPHNWSITRDAHHGILIHAMRSAWCCTPGFISVMRNAVQGYVSAVGVIDAMLQNEGDHMAALRSLNGDSSEDEESWIHADDVVYIDGELYGEIAPYHLMDNQGSLSDSSSDDEEP